LADNMNPRNGTINIGVALSFEPNPELGISFE